LSKNKQYLRVFRK